MVINNKFPLEEVTKLYYAAFKNKATSKYIIDMDKKEG